MQFDVFYAYHVFQVFQEFVRIFSILKCILILIFWNTLFATISLSIPTTYIDRTAHACHMCDFPHFSHCISKFSFLASIRQNHRTKHSSKRINHAQKREGMYMADGIRCWLFPLSLSHSLSLFSNLPKPFDAGTRPAADVQHHIERECTFDVYKSVWLSGIV